MARDRPARSAILLIAHGVPAAGLHWATAGLPATAFAAFGASLRLQRTKCG